MNSFSRRFPRHLLRAQFKGHDAAGRGTLFLTSADVSAGGAFLKSDILLEEGEQLHLEFNVPGATPTLRVEAVVAWVRRFPDFGEPAGMGIEFVAMTADHKAVLLQFLEKRGPNR